jgi:hypothetical protein
MRITSGSQLVVSGQQVCQQRQPCQAPDWAIRAQHRISQLRQLVPAGPQAPVEVKPEPRQDGEWPSTSIL